MVLYTLAVNHPAFIFEQKTQLDSIFNCIKKEKERQLSKKKGGDLDKESSDILEVCTFYISIHLHNFLIIYAHMYNMQLDKWNLNMSLILLGMQILKSKW